MKRCYRVTPLLLTHLLLACLVVGNASQASSGNAAPEPDKIEHGRYLALAADCVVCHTAIGGADYAGGRPIDTPFGVIYSRNLTPDHDTGIGAWSDSDFYRALHQGRSRDGSHLYPACPYPYFTHIREADANAIKEFLTTLMPVNYVVPENDLAWPLNQRGLMSVWKLFFFDEASEEAMAEQEEGRPTVHERGHYLVEALGHCGACHTPKNFLGADKGSAYMQGGVIQGWLAPNNTGDERAGLGRWSEDEIVEYLQTGRNVRDLASGPMAEVIENSTAKMTTADLQAIAGYLKQLPAVAQSVGRPRYDTPEMRAGEAIYLDSCTACHLPTGEAIPRVFTPLKGSAIVQASDPRNVIRVLLQGTHAAVTESRPTPFAMPAFGWKFDDQQVAAVATYVRNAWGNTAPAVKAAQVASLREEIALHEEKTALPVEVP